MSTLAQRPRIDRSLCCTACAGELQCTAPCTSSTLCFEHAISIVVLRHAVVCPSPPCAPPSPPPVPGGCRCSPVDRVATLEHHDVGVRRERLAHLQTQATPTKPKRAQQVCNILHSGTTSECSGKSLLVLTSRLLSASCTTTASALSSRCPPPSPLQLHHPCTPMHTALSPPSPPCRLRCPHLCRGLAGEHPVRQRQPSHAATKVVLATLPGHHLHTCSAAAAARARCFSNQPCCPWWSCWRALQQQPGYCCQQPDTCCQQADPIQYSETCSQQPDLLWPVLFKSPATCLGVQVLTSCST